MKNKTPQITAEDVWSVAKSLNMNPTPEMVQQVIDEHEGACEDDPTGTWNLVVEQQLYSLIDDDNYNKNKEKMENISGVIEVSLKILKDLPDDFFPLNVGSLILSLGFLNYTLDSNTTDYNNPAKKGKMLTFNSKLYVDKETFPKSNELNYLIEESHLLNPDLKALFYCSDCDAGIDDAFDYENAEVSLTITVGDKDYVIKNIELDQ